MTTPESLTRSEAHRKLLALGMPADLAGDCLDHEQVRYANASNYPGAWPILEAYQRHCAARTDPLDTVPPEERERIVATAKGAAVAAYNEAPSGARRFAADEAYYDTIAREVAAYHARQKDEARIAAVFGDKPRTMAQFHGPDAAPDDDSDPVLSSAEEASAPGQTPIGRPPSTITAAFEAMLWFLTHLIAGTTDGTPTLATLAAAYVLYGGRPMTDLARGHVERFRDLIQRAAEEHARGPVPPGLAEYEAHLTASMTPAQKASAKQWAEGARAAPVVPEFSPAERLEIQEIGTGRALTEAIDRAEAERRLAIVGELPKRIKRMLDNPQATLVEWLESIAPREPAYNATTGEIIGILKAHCRHLAGIAPISPDGAERVTDSDLADIEVRAVDASRPAPGLSWFTAVQIAMALAPDGDVTEQARAVQRIAGERQGLTEEEAREMAREALRTETGTWETIITRALLRASRGAPAPGHVSLPRRALESLVKATQYEDDVRDARDVARHVLHQDFLRYEPARTDPEAARQLAEARSARASGDASLEADDPSPIERLAREFDRAAFKQGCGAINHDRGDCYRDAAKRMRAVAAEYLGLTEEQAGNVQSVRRRLGLTQERLGVEIGYRSETISRWENGHEAVPRVVRLALIGLIASHGENDAARRLARPGLTEEEAIRAVRAEMGSAWIDANPVMAGVVVGLLRRASRGVLAPEHREPIPDSIGPRGSSYDGAHASKRGAK